MAEKSRKRGHLTIILFALLAMSELVITVKIGHGQHPFSTSFKYFLISGIPLFFVFSSILLGENLIFPILLGWACILIGFFIHYSYYTTHGSSNEMILGVSIVTYWLCGILALFSVSYQKP